MQLKSLTVETFRGDPEHVRLSGGNKIAVIGHNDVCNITLL